MFLAVAGVVRAWFKSKPGERPWLITIGITGLLLLSLNPLAWLYSRPLEIWYDDNPIPRETADAIVVLAGAVNPPVAGRPYALAGQDTYVRIQHAAWLFKQWGRRPVLACGGGRDSEAYSKTLRRLLESSGIPPDMIWIEPHSRSTHENALYGARILREHGISRIALVIDARSMARAAGSFRKASAWCRRRCSFMISTWDYRMFFQPGKPSKPTASPRTSLRGCFGTGYADGFSLLGCLPNRSLRSSNSLYIQNRNRSEVTSGNSTTYSLKSSSESRVGLTCRIRASLPRRTASGVQTLTTSPTLNGMSAPPLEAH